MECKRYPGAPSAVCKARAVEKGVPLYCHMIDIARNSKVVLPPLAFNMIISGSHVGNKLAMQGFMIFPVCVSSFHKAITLEHTFTTTQTTSLRRNIGKIPYKYVVENVGNEGRFASNVLELLELLELLKNATE